MFLYLNQGIDFDDVRVAIAAFLSAGNSATIHDGDGCVLFGNIPGHSCTGTINDPAGATLATFAIDYVAEEISDGSFRRHVAVIHIGPRGHWCRNLSDGDLYDRWIEQLAEQNQSDQAASPP
jgi:hypothetical protein